MSSEQFYHDFYIILGVDKRNGTKLINVGHAQDFEKKLSQYPTQYPTFVPLAKLSIRLLLSNTDQIALYDGEMKFICEDHRMQHYNMNCNDNGWFALNPTRKSNINTIVELLTVFYTDVDIDTLQSQAETFYKKIFCKWAR